MTVNHPALAARLENELQELEQVVERCLDIWQQAEISGDDRYLDGVALNLHSFYTGLERIFERVAAEIDRTLATGPHWHQELLRQVSSPIPDVRPAVISDSVRERLDRYRGFRHVVRNIYAFQLDRELIAPLIRELAATFARVKAEVMQFTKTISGMGEA